VLGNLTALVAVNNTPVVASAGRVHAASCWPYDSLPVSLVNMNHDYLPWVCRQNNITGVYLIIVVYR